MKQFFLILIIGAVLVSLYFGYIHVVSKVMGSDRSKSDPVQQFRAQKEQTERVQDTQERQRRLMEDRQQRIRDMQRNY